MGIFHIFGVCFVLVKLFSFLPVMPDTFTFLHLTDIHSSFDNLAKIKAQVKECTHK